MRFDIVTIFPEAVHCLLGFSIIKRAVDAGVVTVNPVDLRDFTEDKHRTVDDYPYGGGPGMVLKPEPLFKAVTSLTEAKAADAVIALTPGGQMFDQALARELSTCEHLILLAGHYEGFDQRVLDHVATREVSIGNYVLTGGELPALVLVDAVTRLLPGVLGNEESAVDESFECGMLEYPQYTRPRSYKNHEVPEVLLSGNHQEIHEWRRQKSMAKTRSCRPELIDGEK